MTSLRIEGGHRLHGDVSVSGAKNAVLPLMAASLLGGHSKLKRIPDLADVQIMSEIMQYLGASVTRDCHTESLTVDASVLTGRLAPYELVAQMRASMLVMGPLLARYGTAQVALPGGCAIGARPIDLHLKGFAALGAEIGFERGLVELNAKKLHGASIYLDFPSVGATENIMMAACLAKGTTTIENAATEPEICNLADFLNASGAKVQNAGSSIIEIEGVTELNGADHEAIGDRIEAGTYLIAAAITGGSCHLHGINPGYMQAIIAKLSEMGCDISASQDTVSLNSGNHPLKAVNITTLPYPGFPTDLQAPMLALLCLAEGHSIITETVFENRFLHAEELVRMGAAIHLEGRSAFIKGVARLSGAQVRAADLRGGAALILAGLAAEGETRLHDFWHLQRGYAKLISKMRDLGARLELISDTNELAKHSYLSERVTSQTLPET